MELIIRLEETKKQTLAYFDLPEESLQKTYGDGKWNVQQILHHLTDAETVLYDRIKRVISESRPVIWAFNQEAWEKALSYDRQPLSINREVYQSVRNAIIYLAKEHYAKSGSLEFVHSEMGVRTLKQEFEKVVSHNETHLKQIEKALNNK